MSICYQWASLMAQMVKNLHNLLAMQKTCFSSLGLEDPWRKKW